jgi:hypothetical protein
MKEVIFHLGLPKTGSSALQVFLARNRATLLSKSVDYLELGEFNLGRIGAVSSGNGAGVARSLIKVEIQPRPARSEQLIQEFKSALTRSVAQRSILSSEMFFGANWGDLSDLISQLAAMEIGCSCAYFIRSQVPHLCSLYAQQVKRHSYQDEPDAFIRWMYGRIEYLKYSTFFSRMEGIFGEGNVKCCTYSESKSDDEAIFKTFLDALGIDSAGLEFGVGRVNITLSPAEIRMKLILNRLRPRRQLSEIIMQNAVCLRGHNLNQRAEIFSFITEDLIDEVESYFLHENRSFAREYFGRDCLFPKLERASFKNLPATEDLSHLDVIEFLGGLLVRYDERIARLENRVIFS